MPLEVPRIEDDVLSSSSLILADSIEKVDTRSIGTGMFVLGSSKVRPKMDTTFKRTQKLGIYAQFYNFEVDEQTRKPDGIVEFEVIKKGTNEKIVEPYSEAVSGMQGGAMQVTLKKQLNLADFTPGDYIVNIKVTDKKRNQTVTKTATFTVT
jgi:hypothetical protein